MFSYCSVDLPCTGETSRECHEISHRKTDRLAVNRCDRGIAFENVALLLFGVMPGEFRWFFLPDRPRIDTKSMKFFGCEQFVDTDRICRQTPAHVLRDATILPQLYCIY